MLFEISVPDRGRFFVRANLRMRGTGTVPGRVHGWSASWSKLGDPSFAHRIAYAAGEDICAGETRDKGMLGFGILNDSNHRVSLTIDAYRSAHCQDGAVTVRAGSSLDVWVEDPKPSCAGHDIAAFSYLNQLSEKNGDLKDNPVLIGATPRSIIEGSIDLTAPVRRLEIIGQTELSPPTTANTCDRRYNSGAAWLYVNGASVMGGYRSDTYPPSGGMTHLLLTPSVEIRPEQPGLYRFGLAASVNQIASTQAPAGKRVSGDSIVAAIALRQAPSKPAPRDRSAAPVARENDGDGDAGHRRSHRQAASSASRDRGTDQRKSPGPGLSAKPPS